MSKSGVLSGKSFRSFSVNDNLIAKMVEAVKEGDTKARSTGKIQSFEVYSEGFRTHIVIGRLMIIPPKITDSPEDFPIALMYGKIIKKISPEDLRDMEVHKIGETEFDEFSKKDWTRVKEDLFKNDHDKFASLIVFCPAWSNPREFVTFHFTKDEAKLAELLTHQVFACYFDSRLSSAFNAILTDVDTFTLDVTDITTKLNFPFLAEGNAKEYPDLEPGDMDGKNGGQTAQKRANTKKKIMVLSYDTAGILELSKDELNVIAALDSAFTAAMTKTADEVGPDVAEAKKEVVNPDTIDKDIKQPTESLCDASHEKRSFEEKDQEGRRPYDSEQNPAPKQAAAIDLSKNAANALELIGDIAINLENYDNENWLKYDFESEISGPVPLWLPQALIELQKKEYLTDKGTLTNKAYANMSGFEDLGEQENKEATSGSDAWITDRDEEGKPKTPKMADTADNPAAMKDAEGAIENKTKTDVKDTAGPEIKNTASTKIAYVSHCKEHRNSKGELAEWCVKQHNTGKILTSYKTEEAAKEGLKNMEIHKGSIDAAHKGVERQINPPGTYPKNPTGRVTCDCGSKIKWPEGICPTPEKHTLDKQADAADNPANEKGGESAVVLPKTDADIKNTRGEEPELAPDKNASAKIARMGECEECGKNRSLNKSDLCHECEQNYRDAEKEAEEKKASVKTAAKHEWKDGRCKYCGIRWNDKNEECPKAPKTSSVGDAHTDDLTVNGLSVKKEARHMGKCVECGKERSLDDNNLCQPCGQKRKEDEEESKNASQIASDLSEDFTDSYIASSNKTKARINKREAKLEKIRGKVADVPLTEESIWDAITCDIGPAPQVELPGEGKEKSENVSGYDGLETALEDTTEGQEKAAEPFVSDQTGDAVDIDKGDNTTPPKKSNSEVKKTTAKKANTLYQQMSEFNDLSGANVAGTPIVSAADVPTDNNEVSTMLGGPKAVTELPNATAMKDAIETIAEQEIGKSFSEKAQEIANEVKADAVAHEDMGKVAPKSVEVNGEEGGAKIVININAADKTAALNLPEIQRSLIDIRNQFERLEHSIDMSDTPVDESLGSHQKRTMHRDLEHFRAELDKILRNIQYRKYGSQHINKIMAAVKVLQKAVNTLKIKTAIKVTPPADTVNVITTQNMGQSKNPTKPVMPANRETNLVEEHEPQTTEAEGAKQTHAENSSASNEDGTVKAAAAPKQRQNHPSEEFEGHGFKFDHYGSDRNEELAKHYGINLEEDEPSEEMLEEMEPDDGFSYKHSRGYEGGYSQDEGNWWILKESRQVGGTLYDGSLEEALDKLFGPFKPTGKKSSSNKESARHDFQHDAEIVVSQVLNGGFMQLWDNMSRREGYHVPTMLIRTAKFFTLEGRSDIARIFNVAAKIDTSDLDFAKSKWAPLEDEFYDLWDVYKEDDDWYKYFGKEDESKEIGKDEGKEEGFTEEDKELLKSMGIQGKLKVAGFNFFFPGQVLKEFYPGLQHNLVDYPNDNNTGMVDPAISGGELTAPGDETLGDLQLEEAILPLDEPLNQVTAYINPETDVSTTAPSVSTSPAGGSGIGRDGKPQVLDGVPLRLEWDIRGPMFTDEFYQNYPGVPGKYLVNASKVKRAGIDDKGQLSDFLKRVVGEIAATFVSAFKVTNRGVVLNRIPGTGEVQLAQIENSGLASWSTITGSRIKSLLERMNDSDIRDAINDATAQAAVWSNGGGGYTYEIFVRAESIDKDTMVMKYIFVTGTKG